LRLIQFLGKDLANSLRMSTVRQMSSISKERLTSLKYSLDKYAFDINVNVASPILILPILKNNDPMSPIWVIKLGDLAILSDKENKDQQETKLIVNVSKINIEVFFF